MKTKLVVSLVVSFLLTTLFWEWYQNAVGPLPIVLNVILIIINTVGVLVSGNAHQPNGIAMWLTAYLLFFFLSYALIAIGKRVFYSLKKKH